MTNDSIEIIKVANANDKATNRRQKVTWAKLADRLTKHEVREVKDGACWSPLTMRNGPCSCGSKTCPGKLGHLTKPNVLAVGALVLDIDKYRADKRQLDQAGAERAMARLRELGLRHVVHSSHSHRYPDNASLRVVIALSRPVTPIEWPTFFEAAIEWLGVECDLECSKTVGRIWYLPTRPENSEPIAYAVEGAALDVDAIVASAKPPEPARSRPTSVYTARPGAFDIRDLMASKYPGRAEQGSGDVDTRWDIGGGDCPWAHEHSTKGAVTGTTVFLYTSGKWEFICQHSHCRGRNHTDFRKYHCPDWIPFEERQIMHHHRPLPENDNGEAIPENDNIPHAAESAPDDQPPDGERYRLTEVGNAERYARLHASRLRHVGDWEKWVAWDGKRWALDMGAGALAASRDVMEELYAEANEAAAYAVLLHKQAGGELSGEAGIKIQKAAAIADALGKWANKSSSYKALSAMEKIARSIEDMLVRADDLDRDQWILNVQNGTIDLRTGELRPHRQSDMITKIAGAAYDPEARAPRWEQFLIEIQPDPEVREWIQRFAGYCLTGDTSEHALMFALGDGGNGKNVLLETLRLALGDYAMMMSPDIIMAGKDHHPTGLTELHGRRLVVVSEIDPHQRWSEALVKRLTGDRSVQARRMKENFWEVKITGKFMIMSNERPEVRGTDNGIWRRMRLIPFDAVIAKPDTKLPQYLESNELPGILAWAVRGCMAWQRDRLPAVAAIAEATKAYRQQEDMLGLWLAECTVCVCQPGHHQWTDVADICQACGGAIEHATYTAAVNAPTPPRESSLALYGSYRDWCEANGLKSPHPMSKIEFSRQLAKRRRQLTSGGGRWHTKDERGFNWMRLRDRSRPLADAMGQR